MPLRPRDIYPNCTLEQLKKYLGPVKPMAFRPPDYEEYFMATVGEQASDRISEGTSFIPYRCYSGWKPSTPRFIIPKEVWDSRYYR